MFVIIRIGPFDHGEVRNGGMPEWLFGRPFELRSNDEGYLFYVERLYKEIYKQVEGLLYKDGGPIIGTQIENEYMHSAAPWELTTGTSNEWIPGGQQGNEHMMTLKNMATEIGIDTPFYTCTGWGGAATPTEEMLPLWGGYAFWPWIFYDESVKEHPVTPEYIFRDYHNNNIPKCYNFEPNYEPESFPYACCEIGGGMTVFYQYRFKFPMESVSAMAALKVAGGCNLLGYYMYHGGSNPKGKVNTYLNENSTPKISYDFQAALGEYGQVRDSYRELKPQHYFLSSFENVLCDMKTILPQNGSEIDPKDIDSLRYGIRVKNDSGFIFINNYQDHLETKNQEEFNIKLKLKNGELRIPEEGSLFISKESYSILPFNLDLKGIKLNYSTTQLITKLNYNNEEYYFFFIPEGGKGEYSFIETSVAAINVNNGDVEKHDGTVIVKVNDGMISTIKLENNNGEKINICTITKKDSMNLWKFDFKGQERIVLCEETLIPIDDKIKLESVDKECTELYIFPPVKNDFICKNAKVEQCEDNDIFNKYVIKVEKKKIELDIKKIKDSKVVINISENQFDDLKDIMLRIEYEGDIGYAFIDGELINDNFSNGNTWEIALDRFKEKLNREEMYIYISPIRKNSKVTSNTTMAGRVELAENDIAEIKSIKAVPISEIEFTI
jgi:Beta-galactosidase